MYPAKIVANLIGDLLRFGAGETLTLPYPSGIIIDRVKEHSYYSDCVIIDQEEFGIMDKVFKRSVVLELIKYASCPVLTVV